MRIYIASVKQQFSEALPCNSYNCDSITLIYSLIMMMMILLIFLFNQQTFLHWLQVWLGPGKQT